jgi:hypothetical protein
MSAMSAAELIIMSEPPISDRRGKTLCRISDSTVYRYSPWNGHAHFPVLVHIRFRALVQCPCSCPEHGSEYECEHGPGTWIRTWTWKQVGKTDTDVDTDMDSDIEMDMTSSEIKLLISSSGLL